MCGNADCGVRQTGSLVWNGSRRRVGFVAVRLWHADVNREEVMVKIEFELDDDVYAALQSVVARCNLEHRSSGGVNTHGKLTVKKLLIVLAEDAAMTQIRPASWEAFKMQHVLDSHGY
jgi:hypothetical protein